VLHMGEKVVIRAIWSGSALFTFLIR
jgi:hypothetical protein